MNATQSTTCAPRRARFRGVLLAHPITRLGCAALGLLAAPAAFAQTITSLGSLGPDGGNVDASYAYGVSADGSAVVGFSTSPGGDRAFHWTLAGMQNLGVMPGGTWSEARGVSADGTWIVGFGNSTNGERAFRVLLNNPLADLGVPGATSRATGVSADGTALSGDRFDNFTGYHIFKWTTAGGPQNIGSNFFPIATLGISGDGSTVVGYSAGIGSTGAIRWTQADGIVALAPLPGGNQALARAASYDGTFVAGNSNTSADGFVHAVRWNAGGPLDVGVLPGYPISFATAIHASGVALGGDCISGLDNDAWVWIESTGMMLLSDYLVSEGVDLTGWSALHTCTGFSADGTAIIGAGSYQGQIRAFVARGLSPICGPRIAEQPAGAATCLDGTTALAFIAYGPSFFLPSVQWQRFDGANWINVVDGITGMGTNISGSNSYVLSFSSCNTDVAGVYRAEVIAGCAIRYTSPASLAVNSSGANILLHPQGFDVCPDGAATFTFTQFNASNDPPFAYQWQYEAAPNVFLPLPNGTTTVWDGNNAGEGGHVSGATTSVMTIAADLANGRLLSAAHYRQYRCLITNACASVPTQPAVLKVYESCQQADVNGDNDIDFFDIDPFLLALFNPTAYAEAYPDVHPLNADCNHDGTVDFFDIDAFLACLFVGCP